MEKRYRNTIIVIIIIIKYRHKQMADSLKQTDTQRDE